ncbi:MAG: FHA domain-containing protein [Deltaproteobacteria bacterium]|nr:FHA domain-containing protein [Deltaproteobacteria bacterium]
MKHGLFAFVAWSLLSIARVQAAEVSLFSDPPRLSEDGKTVELVVGARLPGIERAKLEDLSVFFGKKPGRVVSSQPYLDFAADKSKGAESWRPPVSVGLVYLWTEGTPPEMLDGVHRLFKRLPPQTVVLPTPFGQSYFPVVNPVSAARVAGGGLDDQPFIEGDAITFLAAARANVAEVAKDDAPVKALVIVADGRDYTASADPGPFAAFGKTLREANYVTQVIGLPSDDESARANIKALANAAGARLLPARQASELPALTEAAGTLFFDMRVLKVAVPFSTGLWGGDVEVTLQAKADGKLVSSSAGMVTVPASGGMLVLLVGLALIVAGGIGAFFMLGSKRRGSTAGAGNDADDDVEGFLEAVQELVRRRVDPNRAAVELSRWYPNLVGELDNIDVASLDGEQYRLLKSRAGQARIKEFAKALGNADDEDQAPSGDLVGILAGAFSQSLAPADAARQIRARLPDKQWASFARSRFDEVTSMLRTAASAHPDLASPKARGFVLAVQDALRDRDGAEVVVAWLVRAAGPGKRGETLRLARPRTVVGAGPSCQLRIDDKYLGAEHLAITESGGAFSVAPLQGQLKVEGKPVAAERPLVDGETLEFGQGQFVFKAIIDG